MTPNFLIVGSAKCGTTSLYRWLGQHPDVFFPKNKEPSFFVDNYGVRDWEDYVALFADGKGKKAIGDASTSYFASPESPSWIKRVLGPDIKIVIMVRNPVARAFSLYKWMAMEGYEWIVPFERALDAEDIRFADQQFVTGNPEFFWDYMYVRSSFYADRLQIYFDLFGRERVIVRLFDDLVEEPSRVYKDICNFLGLSTSFQPVFTAENRSVLPWSVPLQRGLRKGLSRVGWRRMAPWRPAIRGLLALNKVMGQKHSLTDENRRRLTLAFLDDISRLGPMIGRDLSGWLAE